MKLPKLYAILDTAVYKSKGIRPMDAAEILLNSGIRLMQYRHKAQFTEQRFQEARQIAEASSAAGALFVLNDRSDYARLLHCGVHVGQDDLPPREARKIVGRDVLVGVSTHNEEQLKAAADLPVDYVAIGPVFATGSKANPDPVLGLSELTRFRALVDKPLVAIGGIGVDAALRVLDSGVDSLAVISGLLPTDAGDLKGLARVARQWLEAVEARSPAF